jgi:YD repeat-containing protein
VTFNGQAMVSVQGIAAHTVATTTPEGILHTVTDPMQRTTTMEHDGLGRVAAVHRPDTGGVRFD